MKQQHRRARLDRATSWFWGFLLGMLIDHYFPAWVTGVAVAVMAVPMIILLQKEQ